MQPDTMTRTLLATIPDVREIHRIGPSTVKIAEAMAPAKGDAAPTDEGACDRESKARHAVMSERLPKDTTSDTALDIAIVGRRDKKP